MFAHEKFTMARFSKTRVVIQMGETGLIPVFYHPDPELCKQVVHACYKAGVRLFEFTNRGEFAHEVFGVLSRYAAEELPEMILGVGSVIDAPTAALYMQLGANFVVSPIMHEETALVCNSRKVAWVPGCGSATEISRAHELGAEVVKIFPGSSVGGPGFVKALRGPLPWSFIMPTGDVAPEEQNLKAWFEAGVYCVGMGSKLIRKEDIQKADFLAIEERTKYALNLIKKYRKTRY